MEIALTISPVKDAAGKIIGASKIARDITERRRAQERQKLLVSEMQHRIKNTLATGRPLPIRLYATRPTSAKLS